MAQKGALQLIATAQNERDARCETAMSSLQIERNNVM